MLKFYVNEKLISLHNRFYIKDEAGNNVLELSSKVFSIGRKSWIKDLQGNELAYMQQEVLHLMPHYNIFVDGQMVCQISKKFRFFKNDYILSNGYRVDGDWLALDFSIYDNNNAFAGSIKRKFISIGDKYEIAINNDKEYLLILAIIMAITNDVNNAQHSSSSTIVSFGD